MSTTDTTEPIEEPTISMAEIMEVPTTPLSATERCDRCGAQAYVEAEIIDTGEAHLEYGLKAERPGTRPVARNLLFCAHHYKHNEDAIKAKAKRIIDHREVLTSSEVPNL